MDETKEQFDKRVEAVAKKNLEATQALWREAKADESDDLLDVEDDKAWDAWAITRDALTAKGWNVEVAATRNADGNIQLTIYERKS